MIKLLEITENNFNQCFDLQYDTRYVGLPEHNLAMAYIYRDIVVVYGIYNEDTIIGVISIIRNEKYNKYSFTDFAIADTYKNKGFGIETIRCVIDMLKKEGKYNVIGIRVQNSNARAIHIYEKFGFTQVGTDGPLIIMQLSLSIV